MKLLKLRMEGIPLFNGGSFEMDFFATDRVSVVDGTNMPVGLHQTQIGNRTYSQNVIAIAGINASGKTTLLSYIEFALNYLCGEPIRHAWSGTSKELMMRASPKLAIKALIWQDDAYYLLESNVTMSTDGYETSAPGRYRILQECIYACKSSAVSKSTLSDFDRFKTKAEVYMTRRPVGDGYVIRPAKTTADTMSTFLRDDESIISILTGKDRFSIIAPDVSNLPGLITAETDIVAAFDSSIDELSVEREFNLYRIRFHGREPVLISQDGLNQVLSQGTVVGSNLVYRAIFALKRGSYLLVDELESSLNKSLAQTIVELFMSPDTNPNGATLVFSTHYPELLDALPRKDNVYLLIRDDEYRTDVVKYASKVKRIENKKSEVIFSNFIRGTAPRYYDIERMRDYVQKAVSRDGSI